MDVKENKDLAVVKKAGFIEQISKQDFEQRIKCIVRSKKDIVWWAEHFFRIVSLNTGLGLIKLYDKQKQMLKHLVDNDRSVILSSR